MHVLYKSLNISLPFCVKQRLAQWLPPRETVSFVSPRPSMFAEGNIEVEGKQNTLFPAGPVIKCFVIHPNSKLDTLRRSVIHYRGFRELAPPDHVRVERSCCCFPRELVSFDTRRVTRFLPIGKRVWVGRCNNVKSGRNWKCSFISTVRPSTHTNPSRKRSFSKTITNWRNLKTLGSRFSVDGKRFENRAFLLRWRRYNHVIFLKHKSTWPVIAAFLHWRWVVKKIWMTIRS